jgi:hypothetical protein
MMGLVDGDMRDLVTSWAGREELVDLVRAFGGSPSDMPRETAPRLAWLDSFSDQWDTRQGKERDQASTLHLTSEQEQAVRSTTASLDMREPSRPSRSHYDIVMVLGGLVRACFVRPAYAAELLASGVTASMVVGLGGHRPFSEEETVLAAAAGQNDLIDEFGALDAGMREAFNLTTPSVVDGVSSEVIGERWSVLQYQGKMPVTVAAAPSSDPGTRRANTADAYRWYAETWAALPEGTTVLAVTTPLYVPAQHAAALATLALPFKLVVETVGTPPATGAWAQDFSPSRYLLEVRSAVRAYRSLWAALTEGSAARIGDV